MISPFKFLPWPRIAKKKIKKKSKGRKAIQASCSNNNKKKAIYWFFWFQDQGVKMQCCKMGWKPVVLEPLGCKANFSSWSSHLHHPRRSGSAALHHLCISPKFLFFLFFFFPEPRLQPCAGNKRNYLVSPHFSSPAWGLIKAKRKTQRRSTQFRYRPTTCGGEEGKK